MDDLENSGRGLPKSKTLTRSSEGSGQREASWSAPVLWRFWFPLATVCAFAAALAAEANSPLVLNERRVHLRSGAVAEWKEFDREPDGKRLDLRFEAKSNAEPATLFIRQDDVRQDWFVELNGKRLGKLFLMEADLIHALPVPAGALREGSNTLSIVPPKENDDIVLREIRIAPHPMAAETIEVSVTVSDGTKPLPCRVTVVDRNGTLVPLFARSDAPPPAVRPGVAYIGGVGRVGLAPGDYTVFASRGFEWSVATQRVHVATGGVSEIPFRLRREVPTAGWVSCDTHVHTLTHSRHGDATVDERVLTLAGEGIELPIATEHNLHASYDREARRAGVEEDFTCVTGNEVTTSAGHFNIFPVELDARVPDFRITHWSTLMKSLRDTPGVRVVVLNHPRNVHNGFQPFAATNYNAVTGENKRGPEFTFDAIELMNSSAQQSDYMLVYRDWFALLNHGYRVTGVGSSDGHDVSRYIVGQGRTYISCRDDEPGGINVAAACDNLLAGRALVSMGLLTDMRVEEKFSVGDLATGLGDQVRVSVRVLGPSWVRCTNVSLFANGLRLREENFRLDSITSSEGVKAVAAWTIPRPAHDVHLVVIATGPAVTAPFWAIPRPYQPTSPVWEGRVIGSTNPIRIDADRDGKFTAAREYAKRLVARHSTDAARLLPALAGFDEAVAAQAASLCVADGVALDAPGFAEALKSAAPQTRRGFAAYAATLPSRP